MKKQKGNRNKHRSILAVFCAVLFGSLSLTGCGSSAASQSSGGAAYESAAADTASANTSAAGGYSMSEAAEVMVEEDMEIETGETQKGELSEEGALQRKLIREVNISAETEQYDTCMSVLNQQIASYGGYIENSSYYNDGGYRTSDGMQRNRHASLTIRIPSDQLDAFLGQVAELSNVTYRSENVRDVTLQYVDMESHKNALLTEQERLLDLLSQAESVEDLITIESRLSEVRYQLESMESQLRAIDNQVNYSTVWLDITEVARETAVLENPSAFERIQAGFMKNVYRIGDGFKEFAIRFVIALPILLVWAVILFIIFCVVRLVIRKAKQKQELIHQMKTSGMPPYPAQPGQMPSYQGAPGQPPAGRLQPDGLPPYAPELNPGYTGFPEGTQNTPKQAAGAPGPVQRQAGQEELPQEQRQKQQQRQEPQSQQENDHEQ